MYVLKIALLSLSLWLFGCQQTSENVSSSQGVSQNEKSEIASTNAKPDESAEMEKSDKDVESPTQEAIPKTGITSIYTDLDEKKCKTIESNEDEAWSLQECPGVGGYKLEVIEGDIRQTINVISPSGYKSELNFWTVVSSAFSSVGAKAEWRVKTIDGKPVPFALIVRYNASETPDKPEKLTSYLTVTKIDGDTACVVDVVKPIKNANVKARELADASSGKPCRKGK